MAESLNRLRYAGRDFQTAFDELVARAKSKYGEDFNDFYASTLGVMLIDLFAYAIDNIAFYQDRQASDVYLPTAKLMRAVAKLTRQLGYKMKPAVPSTADLSVTLKNGPYAFDVTIPKGFQFKGPNNLIFEATQDVTYAAGQVTKTVAAREGQSRTDVFTSSGDPSQVVKLARVGSGQYVADGTVQVYVAGVPWSELPFLTFNETNQFECNLLDQPPTIRFGDGTAGNIPAKGAELRVSYVMTSGKLGQAASGSIKTAKSLLVVNGQRIDLTVTNPKVATPGDDPETIEHAQIFAPQVYKARDAVVVQSDFDALTNTFSNPLAGKVAKARSVVIRSADQDTVLLDLLAQVNLANANKVPDATAALVEIDELADDILVAEGSASVSNALVVAAQVEAAVQSAAAETARASIPGEITAIGGHKDVALSKTAATRTQAAANTTSAGTISSSLSDIKTAADLVQTNVDDIQAMAPTTTLADATVISKLSGIESQVTTIAARISAARTAKDEIVSADAQIVAYQSALDGEIGTGGMGSHLDIITSKSDNILDALTSLNAELAIIATQAGGTSADLATIDAKAAAQIPQVVTAQVAVVDPTATIEGLSAQIKTHVAGILADDSKANYIEVPVLARDVNGFLSAPSITLVAEVQRYIEQRKEATVTVQVVDGSPSLALVSMAVKVKVLSGFVAAEVLSEVNKALSDLLKDRDYGDALRLDEAYGVVGSKEKVVVPGVDYVNIAFTEVRDYLGVLIPGMITADGDVVVSFNQVVSRGAIGVTQL